MENTNLAQEIGIAAGTVPEENGNGAVFMPEQLSLVVNTIPAMITYIDSNRHIRFVNKAVERAFGVPASRLVGKHLSQLIGEAGYEAVKDYVSRALKGEQLHYQLEVPLPIGNRIIDATYTPHFDANGKVTGYIALVNDVTEATATERELERKRRELQDYVDNAPVGLHWVDAEGNIIWANEAEMKMLGYEPAEYVGHSIAEFHAKPDIIEDILARLGRGETLREYEAYLKCKDGSVKTVLINSNVLWENGKFVHTRCFTTDITERVKLLEALRKSETHYREIFTQAPLSFSIYMGPDYRTEFINDLALKIAGRTREELLHRPIFELYPELEEQGYKAVLDQVYRGEKVSASEQRIQYFKNGELQVGWFNYMLEPFRDEDGRIVGVISMSTDVTEQVLSRKKVESSEKQYRDLVERLPLAMYSCDREGRITFYNDVAVRLWGYRPEINSDAVKFCACAQVWLPDGTQVSPEQTPMAIALQTGRSFRNLEARVQRLNGEFFYASVNIDPLFDEQGEVIGAVNIFEDITERKTAEEELRRSEAFNRTILQNSPDCYKILDTEGNLLFMNSHGRAMMEIEDFTPFDRKPWAEFFCGEYRERALDAVRRAAAGEIVQFEATCPTLTGKERWWHVIVSPVNTGDEQATKLIAVSRDITEDKRRAQALEESERRYQNLIHGLPAAIYTTDAEGIITMYNQAAVQLWGREPQVGKDMWCGSMKIFDRDGVTEIPLDECPMAVALKEQRKVTVTEPFIVETPTGERKWFLPHPEPVFDTNGRMTGAVNMLFDVTEHKKAEEQSAKLAAIVQSSEDAIFSMDLEGKITSWNPAAQRLYGYAPSEIIGKSIRILIPNEKDANDEIEKIRRGEVIEHFDTKRRTKDGRLIDVSLTVSPIRNNNGQIIGISKIARDITEQKGLHEELREKEEGLRMAMESANMGTWEYNPFTFRLSCSRESCRICGIPDGMEPGFDLILKHIYEEDQQKFIDHIKAAIKDVDDGKFDMLIRIRRYDNQEMRWVRAKGKVFFGADKLAQRLIGTMMDVTEEKEAEQLIRNSEERLKTIADNVPAMIWMSGNDSFNDYFNKTWLEYTGRTLEQESNEGWLENVHPDDVQRCIDNYNESYRKQKGVYTEYRLRRHDGQYRWIADNSVPRYNARGEFTGFISACMDIDDQKRFREKIRDSELLFKTISNASPTGLWMTDTDGQNVFVNDTWVNWTGKSFEEQLEEGWLTCILDEDKEQAYNLYRECAQERRYYKTEFRFRKHDGEIRWGLTEGYPYYDSSGNFSGYAGSVTDITEIKKLEERKDDFIKMASHELKTPITSISGYVQLLVNIYDELNEEKMLATRETVKSSLQTISKQVNKLTRLVSELLDLSRIESGQLKLDKRQFDLGELVEEVAQDARQITTRHAVIVRNEFNGMIEADRDRIAQVVLNLLTNAIKYSPDSNSIEVSVKRNHERALVKVKDTGIGIDKREHKRIFERFYRVEGRSEQTYPGFGIGLFIANEIVQRHNGQISLESEKGKGSEFTISLPLN